MTAVTGAAASAAAAGTANAQSSEEVTVGPGGDLVFEPADLTIANGTTVNFVWDSDNHNIVVDSQPDGAGWEGHEPLENSGFETSHTFDTNGEYEYFCQPHVGVGMEATITVQDSVETEAADTGPVLPESAKTLGVATVAAMLSVLSLAYFFLRYGGDFETPE